MAEEKKITLVWRDEAYGSVSSRAVAFRTTIDPFPSQTARGKIARTVRKGDFQWNDNRASWINESGSLDAQKLVDDLEALGYTVNHAGAVPDVVADLASAAPTP